MGVADAATTLVRTTRTFLKSILDFVLGVEIWVLNWDFLDEEELCVEVDVLIDVLMC